MDTAPYSTDLHHLIPAPPGGGVFIIDRDLRYLMAVGEALLATTGLTPGEVIGKSIVDVFPPPVAAAIEPHLRKALAGSSYDHEYERRGRHFLAQGVPVRDAAGEIYAAMVVVYDITDRRNAEDSQRQLAIELQRAETLHAISTQLISESNPEELYARIVDAAMVLMRADAASIQMLEPGTEVFRLLAWRGLHSQSASFWDRVDGTSTTICGQAIRDGRRAVVEDVEQTGWLTGTSACAEYQRSGIRAMQSTVLTSRFGRPVGMLSTHWKQPHTPLESDFRVFDVLARQAADLIERAAVLEELRGSDDRRAFLLALSDRMRPLTDAVEILHAAATALGEYVGASRVGYAEDQADGETVAVTRHYTRNGQSIEGRYKYDDFGPELLRAMRAGQTVVRPDVPNDPSLKGAEREAHAAIQLASVVNVPLVKGGRLVSILFVHADVPRNWTPEEVSLCEEVAERTWAAVERGRSEVARRESEARLRRALDAARMGTFEWSAEDDHTEADQRMLDLFGLPTTGSISLASALGSLIHPEDRERYADAVRATLESRGSLNEDIRIMLRDGKIRWLAVTAQAALAKDARQSLQLVGTVVDVTERKHTESALRRGEALLKEADQKKDEFLATLAHELRNPLAPIRTGLELIRVQGDNRDGVERVRQMMERQVGHMVRLIDDLLDVSRITSGKIRLQRSRTPLGGLVHEAIEANRVALNEARIDLSVNLESETVWLNVDSTRIVQVISNVLHNAVKFSDVGGRILIASRLESRHDGKTDVVLSVTDQGAGISGPMLPRVFELFAQEESSSMRSQGGLGIGLALARRLAELHEGSIEATSEGLGCGSTFTIRLECSHELSHGPTAAETASATRVPLLRRVMVVDDNVDAADSLSMLVETLGGTAQVAHDGASALQMASAFRPDVILLDIGMPGMDGYETARRIRIDVGAGVTLVALTGWGQERDKEEAVRAGFDAHLTKPVDLTILQALLAPNR